MTSWIAKFLLSFRKDELFLEIKNISKKILIMFIMIFFSAMFIYILANFNTVDCVEDLSKFFERQHNLRVEIINDLIMNTSEKDVLIAIHKVVNSKVALLREEVLISNDIDFTPLIKEPESFREASKRFFFWIFCIIMSVIMDGAFTFVGFLFGNTTSLQELIAYKFSIISSNYDFVNDVYNILESLELFKE